MPKLLTTQKVKNQHTHIVYMTDDGNGQTSKNQGHQHLVVNKPPIEPTPPQLDMMGMPIPGTETPGDPGGVMVMPGEDGHTHQLAEYEPKEKDEKEDDGKIVTDVLDLKKEAEEYEKESLKDAEAAEKMLVKRSQWRDEDARKLAAMDRAAITVNKIESKLDMLGGYQRQNRTDIKFYAQEDGDQEVADLLSSAVKNITENTNFSREETNVFDDAVIVGRGLFHVYVRRDKSPQGDIAIERFPWREVKFTAHEKEDLEDCDALLKVKFVRKRKLEQLYPDKIDKLTAKLPEEPSQEPHDADTDVCGGNRPGGRCNCDGGPAHRRA